MPGWYLFLAVIIAIVGMVLLISKLNWHPFVVLLLAAYFVGIVCGIPVDDLISTITSGFGSILGSIGIVILAGTIIGTILEKTGAALTMANAILKVVGKKRAPLTMSLTGYVVSIPVFAIQGSSSFRLLIGPWRKNRGFHWPLWPPVSVLGFMPPIVWFHLHLVPLSWPGP